MWHQLLLAYSLVSSTLGQSSFVSYLLLIPAEVHYPSTETAFVHITGPRDKLIVTITLQYGVQDNILLQQEVNTQGLFKSIQFQSPPPEGGREEVVSVHISLVGPNTQISESKNILVRGVGSSSLIQTDKPIYKPGQDVNFRMLTFNRDFLAVDDNCPLVEIHDPNKNRIGQWLNVTPQKGIIDLSYSLDSEAQPGTYTITSANGFQDFHVSDYVMPNFDVTIEIPHVVTVMDETFPMKICGRYTFGKPVQGEIHGKLCRKASCYYWHSHACPEDICTEYRGQTDRNGCLEVEVVTEPYKFRSYDYQMSFQAEASLIEDGTGTQINVTSSCRISAMIAKVTFEDSEISNSYYKPGLRYKAKMKLESADGSPMKSQTLYLTEKYDKVTREHVYETDENGEARFTLNTRHWNGHSVILLAVYKKKKPERTYQELNPYFLEAYRTLLPFTSITNSFLKIQPHDQALACDKVHQIEIDYIIRGSELITEEDKLELHYVVMAKGNLVLNGQMKINVSRNYVTMGILDLPLMVTADIAPLANILVYALFGNGRIAADTEEFPVTRCFNNKVTLNFSKHEASPGSNVTLHVNAHPGSLCSVRAVDEGVLFMRPEAEISSDAAYHFLSQRNRYGYPYRVREDEPMCWTPYRKSSSDIFNHRKRSLLRPTTSSPDVFTLIKHLGLKIITNTNVKKPQECLQFPQVAALSSFGLVRPNFDSHNSNAQSTIIVDKSDDLQLHESVTVAELTKKIRRMFPKTWIWDMVTVGTSGQADIQVQLPDSITEWKTTAFCMGDVGLGIAPTASLTAFQSFFVELKLPYSLVRGETFNFTGTVFNYLSRPLMVKANLQSSQELKVNDCSMCNSPQCLLPEQTKVFIWEAKALQTGSPEIVISTEAVHTEELCEGELPVVPENGATDTLMKTVTIKAEGIPVEKSHNSILCGGGKVLMTEALGLFHDSWTVQHLGQLSTGDLSSEIISIIVPPTAVPDSAVATFSVVGDMMGSALQGIEKLLNLPTGCGEQTMVKLVPNIFLLDYLESVDQLTDEIQQQGVGYIIHGYQKELNYQREDGSFSAFGERDKEGNTWLSAFVMKSFHAASRYIPVDKKYIQEIANWLKENQLPSGCFKNRGKLFKASLKGGVDDEISLNAYVTVAVLETGWSLKDEMLQGALQCLRNSVFQVDSLYTKAILAYMFTLSRDYEIRDILLQELHKKAVKTGEETYWPAIQKNHSKDTSWSQPNSNEVELASYVTLAHLSLDSPMKEDISNATSVAHWIVRQRNPYGGFDNTQDTVVGLQALCLVSKTIYTRLGGLQVILTSDGENSLHHFHVDEATRFLLQKRQLKKLPGTYKVQVRGQGCAFLQTTLKYNTYPAKVNTFFDLQANVTTKDIGDHSKSCLHFTIFVRYIGPRNVTNMVLLETELPSGFNANAESITKLGKGVETFTFSAEQEFSVKNQKPQSVKVYDYYEAGEEDYMMYNLPT